MTPQFQERDATSANGLVLLALSLAMMALGAYGVLAGLASPGLKWPLLCFGLGVGAAGMLCLSGIYALSPNQCALFLLFGKYVGSDRADGLRWTNPFYTVLKRDLRTQTLITPTMKVNDQRGNPIEVAAMVVWHVEDAAAAAFGLQDIHTFLTSTLESTLREIASSHPYDHADEEDPKEITLRGHVAEISDNLSALLRRRMNETSGAVAISTCKLTHLAYAPEIANAMLRRQQAEAVVSARKKIVLGAVGMVDDALKGLAARGIEIDDDRRAAMVGNLLVVLCAEREAQPVVNAGGL